jgi:integrating conjugative element protein (TIGR03765 family)
MLKRASLWLRLLAAHALCAGQCLAQATTPANPSTPVVIFDSGRTVSVSQLYAPLFSSNSNLREAPRSANLARSLARNPLTNMFPLRTTAMTVGALPANSKVAHAPTRPLCVIGDDPTSQRWLAARLKWLHKNAASCVVVSAASVASFVALRDAAQGLEMAPALADGVAKQTGLRTYPFVITVTGEVLQ